MAKVKLDTSRIAGWDDLSAEDRVKALLEQEIEVEQTEPAETLKLKNALNKACEEAASYKKALREKQSEAERAEADRAEREKALQDELASYRDKERISSYKAQLMSAGVDSETADLMAKSLPEGVSDEYFLATKSFLDNQRQKLLTESINKQPGLSVGTPPTAAQAEREEENLLRKHMGLPLR